MLSPPERAVLCRLAVFAGGFDLQAAKAVVADDQIQANRVFEYLGSLVRKSMVAFVPATGQFRLLETTRAFALEQLQTSGEATALRKQHAQHLLRMLEKATDEWETTSDARWLARYGMVVDDLRSALDWATAEDAALAVALAGASWPLWRELSLRPEGRQRLNTVEARLPSEAPPVLEARLRLGSGDMWSSTADVKTCHSEYVRAVALYRSLNDPLRLGSALTGLGAVLLKLAQFDEASQCLTEALNCLEGTPWPRALATGHCVQLCVQASLGRYDAARASGERSLRLCEMTGFDRLSFVVADNMIELLLQMDDVDGAIAAGRYLLERNCDTAHSDLLGFALGMLAGSLIARGDLDEGLASARGAAPLLRDQGSLYWLFDHLALRAGLAGRAIDAARIAGYADAVYRKHAHLREPVACRAVERLNALLQETISGEEIVRLYNEGASFTEDQALMLALRS